MKKAIDTLLAIALAACTAENIPEKPTTPEPTTEKVSINIRLAEPATKALINDSGSGAASFSWENGDQIGVVVGNKYYCFTLEGKTGEDIGTFTAELPGGSTIEDGAQIAYPYIADDYNESSHTFSLTYPTEYTSTKSGDFRHRWAGTLVKDGNNNFQANLAHQTAILRITYANVPADATAIKITADKNLSGSSKTITINFSWHAPTMDFYVPVPAETYTSFTIQLYNGANAIDGTQRTLANTSMVLETGKIYRTPTAALGPKKIQVAYFSFTNNTQVIATSMADCKKQIKLLQFSEKLIRQVSAIKVRQFCRTFFVLYSIKEEVCGSALPHTSSAA